MREFSDRDPNDLPPSRLIEFLFAVAGVTVISMLVVSAVQGHW